MKRTLFLALLLAGAAGQTNAGACDDPGTIRRSAVVNIGAATTTKIVDAVAGARI